jgi:hypothetical protein
VLFRLSTYQRATDLSTDNGSCVQLCLIDTWWLILDSGGPYLPRAIVQALPGIGLFGNILWRRYLAFRGSLAIWLLAEGHTLCHSTLLKKQLDTFSSIRVSQDLTEPCIGLSPVSDWALCWAEPCIGLSPVSDWALYRTEPCIRLILVSDWALYRTEPCIRLSFVSDWALYLTEPCIRLSPVSDWALYWAEPCIKLSPVSDCTCSRMSLVSDWALYRTEPCIGLSPVSDWALYRTDWALYLTDLCIGLSHVLDWTLYWTEPCIRLSPVSDYPIFCLLHWIWDTTFLLVWNLISGQTVSRRSHNSL